MRWPWARPRDQQGRVRRGDWMSCWTGTHFWPLDPRADEVTIDDLVVGLARECRYGNHSRDVYSVAEHSVIVSCYVPPRHAREALLHDASEAYLGDMIQPLKHQRAMRRFRRVEAAVQDAVLARFDICSTIASRAAIKAVERRLFVDEVEALMLYPDEYKVIQDGGQGLGAEIYALEWQQAATLFAARFAELFPEHRREAEAVAEYLVPERDE